jgi:hypothetical protein
VSDSGTSLNARWGLAFALTLLVGAALYLPKVTANIGWYNNGEFVAAAMTLDVPHAPGYPLLTRLGNLTLQLFGESEPAFKLNVLSAFIGIVSAALLLWLLKLAGTGVVSAFCAAVLLLASKTYFEQAILIEVYCLEILFITLGLIVGMYLAKNSNSKWIAFAAGLTGTLGVGHRPTFVLFALTLIFFINKRTEPLKKLSLTWFILGIALGAIPSLDLYLRLQSLERVLLDPLVGQGVEGFLRVYTGTVYGGGLFALGFSEVVARFFYFFEFIFKDSPVFLLPLAFAALFINNENSPLKKALVFIGMINLLFVLNYNAFEAHSMLLPAIFSLSAMAAFALNAVKNTRLRYLACFVVIVISLFTAAYRQQPVDSTALDYCRRAFSQVPKNSVVLLSNDVEFRPYYYLRLTKNFRTDVAVQLIDNIESNELKVFAGIIEQRNVYGTFVYPQDAIKKIVASFSLIPQGYGYEIAAPQTPESAYLNFAATEKKNFQDSTIELPDLNALLEKTLAPGAVLNYNYAFNGSVKDFKDLVVFAFLSKAGDQQALFCNEWLVAQDCHVPGDFVNKAAIARSNTTLLIERALVLPPDIKPGKYHLELCFFSKDHLAKLPEEIMTSHLNGFNIEGYLEVFKLNYGQTGRIMLDRQSFDLFEKNIKPAADAILVGPAMLTGANN